VIPGSLCPSRLLGEANSLASRRRQGAPRFGVTTSAVQLAQNREGRIHMFKLIYQIRSLDSQLLHDANQAVQMCHKFPSAKDFN
jgi:hypothetical protein